VLYGRVVFEGVNNDKEIKNHTYAGIVLYST
jgi:hypothetical protein